MTKITFVPVWGETCLMKFMGEVFEFTVEEVVGLFNGWSRYARKERPRYSTTGDIIKEKFWCVGFAPFGVGGWFGGDVRFEPRSQRTVCPCVLRHLQADESAAVAKCVGEAKG